MALKSSFYTMVKRNSVHYYVFSNQDITVIPNLYVCPVCAIENFEKTEVKSKHCLKTDGLVLGFEYYTYIYFQVN